METQTASRRVGQTREKVAVGPSERLKLVGDELQLHRGGPRGAPGLDLEMRPFSQSAAYVKIRKGANALRGEFDSFGLSPTFSCHLSLIG